VSDTGGAAALSCLSRLCVLDLSCTNISNAGLLALAPMRNLHNLNLDMCHIGDEGCRVRGMHSTGCPDGLVDVFARGGTGMWCVPAQPPKSAAGGLKQPVNQPAHETA
jgi:hypothetical protein